MGLVGFLLAALTPASALAHHEALFGPQSSLATESEEFVSLQTHTHAMGIDGQSGQETTFIVSGGLSPLSGIPWSVAFVQPFTYETSQVPTAPGTTGPFTTCDGCFRRENALVATQYRFAFRALNERFAKDGNFALASVALEVPTGNKDYPPLAGPFNAMFAGMSGLEKGAWSAVLLGYYRLNSRDATASKKGDNLLGALGGAWTPIDERSRMVSLQLGLGYEFHLADLAGGAAIVPSGGWEVLASPTVVWMPLEGLRLFVYVSVPVVQNYPAPYQVDRWRAGLGCFYAFSFSRTREPGSRGDNQAATLAATSFGGRQP